jgi:hypothetical protein
MKIVHARVHAHTNTIGAMEETLEVVVGDLTIEVLMIEEVLQELDPHQSFHVSVGEMQDAAKNSEVMRKTFFTPLFNSSIRQPFSNYLLTPVE